MFIWKPWYVYRPKQIVVRARRAFDKVPPVTIRWITRTRQDRIKVNATKTIGASIWTIGIYGITVSKVLAQLICPGDVVVVTGVNVGCKSVLTRRVACSSGHMFSFEPHPALFQPLKHNVEEAKKQGKFAKTTVYNVALSDTQVEACLSLPQSLSENNGTAQIIERKHGTNQQSNDTRVPTDTLDQVLGESKATLLKLDVEGHEVAVLHGAAKTLAAHRIRHIIYEDFVGSESKTASLLRAHGYTTRRIGAKISGAVIAADHT